MKRVLICGGRTYDNHELMSQEMRRELGPDDVVIQGEQHGADLMAKEIAQEMGLTVESYPADWEKYGPKRAGPIRNKQMIDEGKPDVVWAFPGAKGTQNMIDQAREADIPVIRYLAAQPL